ncbi:MAG: hypothetical protein IPL32_16890 [Chloracidobacterium sp.]|nr:hypothetical protein [Chloracidobacterium sp.]
MPKPIWAVFKESPGLSEKGVCFLADFYYAISFSFIVGEERLELER